VLSGVAFAGAQILDRSGLVPSLTLGIRDPYVEEGPELLGALALLCLMIHFLEARPETASDTHAKKFGLFDPPVPVTC